MRGGYWLVGYWGVVAQWQSTWHGKLVALGSTPGSPPFFPALSPFQRSTDSKGKIRSLIRPRLISLWT